MIRTHQSPLYSPSAYDIYMCLKPPLLLWGAVLFLSRAISLPLAIALGRFAGVNGDALSAMRGLWDAEALVPGAIAALLLYVFIRRVPGASTSVRWLWAHGRALLAVAAALDLVLAVLTPIRAGEINDHTLLALLLAAVDVYILLYVFLARRVRDTFAEFPVPDPVKPLPGA